MPLGEEGFPFWFMTVFRFAGEFLEMRAALLDKKAVAETVRGRLVRGLNRVMTGLLIDNVDRIFVASSGGFTQSRVSVLCDTCLLYTSMCIRDRYGVKNAVLAPGYVTGTNL